MVTLLLRWEKVAMWSGGSLEISSTMLGVVKINAECRKKNCTPQHGYTNAYFVIYGNKFFVQSIIHYRITKIIENALFKFTNNLSFLNENLFFKKNPNVHRNQTR